MVHLPVRIPPVPMGVAGPHKEVGVRPAIAGMGRIHRLVSLRRRGDEEIRYESFAAC